MKIFIITEKRTAGAEIASTLDDPYFKKMGLNKLLKESGSNGFLEGEKYILCWASGHLYSQKKPADMDQRFRLWNHLANDKEYRQEEMLSLISMVPSPEKNKVRQRKILKKILQRKDIESIYNGCDADDEGQAIFEHIMAFLGGNKRKLPVNRLWITGSFKSKVAIEKAFLESKKNSEPKFQWLYHTQIARSTCDLLLGSKTTKTASDMFNNTYYIGRVKAIIISLIGNRMKEISMFTEKPFWGMVGKIGNLSLNHFYYTEEEVTDATGKTKISKKKEIQYFKKAEIDSVFNGINREGLRVRITKMEVKRTSTKTIPLPLSGSDFSAQMMAKFPHLSYRDTETQLDYLRDGGWTTYPGTNGRYFSVDDTAEVKTALDTIKAFYGYPIAYKADSPVFNNAKAEKQNHPPLHVTEKIPSVSDVEEWKKAPVKHLEDAYRLIAMRMAATFMPLDEIENQHLVVESRGGCALELRGKKVIVPGWRKYLDLKEEDTTFNAGGMKIGDQITLSSVALTEGKTKPAEQYTTKSLLATMMNVSGEVDKYIRDEVDPAKIKNWKNIKRQLNAVEGLGTDRTRSNIMQELIDNGIYDEDSKNKLALTEKGWELYEILPKLLKSMIFSAQWEGFLDQIRQGKVPYKRFIKKIDSAIMDIMVPEIIGKVGVVVKPKQRREPAKKDDMGVDCPLCGKKVLETGFGFICETNKSTKEKHSGCRFFVYRKMEKTLGRSLEGKKDLEMFLSSNKENIIKENLHGIYFDKKEKNFTKVVWTKKEKTVGDKVVDASQTRQTDRTWKQGTRFFYKNVHKKDITQKEAEEIFNGKKVLLERKSAKGEYLLEVSLVKDGQLNITFANKEREAGK